MEIGTEISKKIRVAIKGKLQELDAYVDEELPDYIMVMVANKKTSQQMPGDLALFLGNNTIKFTVWLHGVLEKRRSVAVEPESMRPPLYSEAGISAAKSQRKGGGGQRGLWCPVRSLIGRRPACPAPPMSTEGSPQTRPPGPAVPPRSSPRWTPPRPSSTSSPSWTVNSSARTPWTWASCLVACVDLTLEEEEVGRRLRSTSRPQGRPSSGTGRSADAYRSSEGSSGSHSRHQHGSYHMDSRSSRDCRAYRVGGSSRHPEWETRKRKAPVVSSVVRVNQAADEGPDSDELEEEDDEEDEGYGVKSMSSRVSMPSKPEHSLSSCSASSPVQKCLFFLPRV